MTTRQFVGISIVSISLLGGCTMAGPLPGGGGPTIGRVATGGGAGASRVSAGISVGQARELALNNGLTGRRGLPPGIARNLARGKRIPPGIQRQLVPGSMLGQLPRIDGYEWRMAGTDLVLIALGTLLVVDILEDVFR